jgi:hypothetical protein
MEYPYYHHQHSVQTESSDWAGYVALVLIIVIVIALVIFYFFSGGSTTVLVPKWTVISVLSANIFVGNGGAYYLITGNLATGSLMPPTDPIGQSFIVDNSKSTTDLSLSVGGTTKTIAAGQIATFVWTTASLASIVAIATG